MKWYLIGAAGLLFVAGWGMGEPRPGARDWLTDYETARALARKTGKPLMVVFRCEP